MSGELERLLIRLEADTTAMRSALKDAEKGVDTFTQNADKRLGGNERRFQSYNANVAAALRPLGAMLAGVFTVQSLAAAAQETAAIQNLATVAGLTTQRYQELQFATRSAGAETATFEQASKKFASVMGEVRSRLGETYTFLRDQLPEVKAQLDATRSISDAWDVAAEAVRRLSTAEDKALFVKKMFGEEAVALIPLLEKGSAGLKDAAKAAENYGAVVNDSAIKNTKELTTQVGILSDALQARLKNALGEIAPYLTQFTKGALDALNRPVFQGVGEDLGNIKELETSLKGLDRQIQTISTRYAELNQAQKDSRFGQNMASSLAQLEFQSFQLNNRLESLKSEGVKDVKVGFDDVAASINRAVQSVRNSTVSLGEWDTVAKDLSVRKKPNYAGSDALAQLREAADVASNRDMEALNRNIDQQIERYRRMLKEELISEQEFNEARALIREQASTRIMQIMQKENAEQAKIYGEMRQAIEGPVMNAMDGLFRTGKLNAKDMFNEILIGFEKMLVQALILKPIMEALFPASGIGGIGSLFGGFRASGGPVSASTPYLVGEKGPELFVPRSGGTIMNATQTAGMGGSGGGGHTFHIDARGADIGVEDRIRAVLQQMTASQASPVGALNSYRSRFPTRRA